MATTLDDVMTKLQGLADVVGLLQGNLDRATKDFGEFAERFEEAITLMEEERRLDRYND